jgi:hypothetical protein
MTLSISVILRGSDNKPYRDRITLTGAESLKHARQCIKQIYAHKLVRFVKEDAQ